MTVTSRVTLAPELIIRVAAYIRETVAQNKGVEAAALFTLNGKCLWASDQSLVRIAPDIARIGIASLRLWTKVREGRVERVGLMTGDGVVDIVFIPPIASLLVVSGTSGRNGWPDNEPGQMIAALGL